MPENVLILGGNGFLGSHLVDKLCENHYNVRVFDRFSSGISRFNPNANVEVFKGDFREINLNSEVFEDIDYLFHNISTTNPVTSRNDLIYDAKTNLLSTLNILDFANQNGIKRVFFSSSGGTVYGNQNKESYSELDPPLPIIPYGIIKYAIERYFKYYRETYGLDYVIFRYSNPYGPRQNFNNQQGVIPIFLHNILNNKPPCIWGNGNSIRDYIYIDDAIDATIQVLKSNLNNDVFNVGSGCGTSLNQLIRQMEIVTKKSIIPKYLPANKSSINKVVLDIKKITKLTFWHPKTELIDGLEKTWEWLKNTN